MAHDAGRCPLIYSHIKMGPGLSRGRCKSLQLDQFQWEVQKYTDLTGRWCVAPSVLGLSKGF